MLLVLGPRQCLYHVVMEQQFLGSFVVGILDCHGIAFVVYNHNDVCLFVECYVFFPILLSSYILVSRQACIMQFPCGIMRFETVW